MSVAGLPEVVVIGETGAALEAALIGNKGANLARLAQLGLRVPPAIALTTEVSREYLRAGALPRGFRDTLAGAVRRLEAMTGLTLGSREPLLLSARSSPPISMPGMLRTVLNVGLTVDGVDGLIARTGNPWFAWDAYRRLIEGFADTVYNLPASVFDEITAQALAAADARSVQELDPISLRELAIATGTRLAEIARPLPADPLDQIVAAAEAVLASWTAPKAREYRRANGISDTGTAVLIQAMVFGNAGSRSGAGVGFTRNPVSGDDELYVDFAFNAQGEDIVSGQCAVTDSAMFPAAFPDVWLKLQTAKGALETEFLDMQEFEFTVEEGELYFLQTRTGKRTPRAAVRVATDLVKAGIIDPATALERVAGCDLGRVARASVHPKAGQPPIGVATPASDGVASGRIAFSSARARELAGQGPVILVRPGLTTDDFSGLSVAAGILTTFGGRTSHAAVLARQLGRVCLVGCADLRIDDESRSCTIGTVRLREGDTITLDAESGRIYEGEISVVSSAPADALAVIDTWRQHS